VARTRDRHAAVHSLLAAGHSQRAAAAILGLSRNTVNRFAAAATADELLVKATSRASRLDRYKPCLRQRWNEGITTATTLHAELQARGWHGSVQAVERYVRPFRAMTAAPPPGPVPAPEEHKPQTQAASSFVLMPRLVRAALKTGFGGQHISPEQARQSFERRSGGFAVGFLRMTP